MAEQRYQAPLAVIADGLSVSQVADKVGVSRQTLHAWLARYEPEGPADRSHRPARCLHQILRRPHRQPKGKRMTMPPQEYAIAWSYDVFVDE